MKRFDGSSWILFFIVFFFVSFIKHSECLSSDNKITLPKTGQTTKVADGDDGDLQKGAAWPNTRFTENNDGTVKDNLTGLIWLKNANCANTATDWETAFTYISQLNTNGKMNGNDCNDTSKEGNHQTDWRLPNANELKSLLNRDKDDTSAWLESPTGVFNDVQSDYYWSSTTYVYINDGILFYDKAWRVNMSDGSVDGVGKGSPSSYYIFPVRGGQSNDADPSYPANIPKTGQKNCYILDNDEWVKNPDCSDTPSGHDQDGKLQKGVAWPEERFTDNGDGTVKDNLSGLIWLKDANCTETIEDVNKSDGILGWENSLIWTNNLAVGYCNLEDGSSAGDWRLPNINELMSLVNAGYNETDCQVEIPCKSLKEWLDKTDNTVGVFDNVQSNYYWSSTTLKGSSPDKALGVSMEFGDISGKNKDDESYYVLPVRGGVTTFNLSITKSGIGPGTVVSDPSGINCGSTCSKSFNENQEVTLTASAGDGSTFAGWSGSGCSGTGSCKVTINSSKTVTATFSANPPPPPNLHI